jgi:hypothetical protein
LGLALVFEEFRQIEDALHQQQGTVLRACAPSPARWAHRSGVAVSSLHALCLPRRAIAASAAFLGAVVLLRGRRWSIGNDWNIDWATRTIAYFIEI